MNTKPGGELAATAAAVIGARHLRAGRNGQDAARAWTCGRAAALVVCDGCGSGESSEVGARLGAALVLEALRARLAAGAPPLTDAAWAEVRAEVAGRLAVVAGALPGAREDVVHAHLLFTIVAAVVTPEAAAIWALGDGAYRRGDEVVALGPFEGNAPPYLGYDLLGAPAAAHLVVGPAPAVVMVATDGVDGLADEGGLGAVPAELASRPDALRRHLAVRARPAERIDWDAGRIHRAPAPLQDDAAVAIARRLP